MAINEKATVEVQVNGQQARQELNQLREYATNLSAALEKAYEAGDKKQIKALTKELKYVNSQMKTLQRTSVDIDKVMMNLSTTGPKELRQTLKAINAELSSGRVQRGSEEWAKYAQAARQVSQELKKIKEETEGAQQSFSDKLAATTTKWWGFYTISSDLYERLNSFATSKVQAFAQMDEAMSQVTKYTGMARDEVKGLNEDFKKMDTRTAREQLNALAGDAGRLGIQAKDQVLEFVDAADKINVALGEDLGEDAVKNIGKLAMMFGEDKTKGMRAAMLATGSAVNEVAQNCSAAEPFLVNFTARVAGAAHQAGIAQADILGFAASMDENMLREETSATAYQNILMKMYTSTEKFADAAGIEFQTFSDLLRTDANEALLQFAEGLSKRGGLADLAPLFGDLKTEGAGVSSVLSVMAGKADEIRARQALANKAYQEGTSILKEFDVQNNTVQAGLDKAKKRANDLAVELGERLQPIMAEGLHLTSAATKIMISVLDFSMKHKAELIAIAAAYVLYNGAIKAHNAYLTISNGITKTATTLRIIHAAATANLTGNLTGANKILTIFNANMIKSAAGQKAATAAVYLFSAAKAALTGNIKTATIAIRALWTTLNLNPFVAIATAVLAAGAAIYAFTSRTTEADKAMKSFSSANMQEQQEMYKLYDAIRKTNEGTKQRKDLINEFNSKYGSYISNLLTEKTTVDELAAAYREASTAIQNKIAMQKIEEAKTNVTNESIEARGEAMSKFQSILQRTLPASMADNMRSTVLDYVNTNLAKGFSVKQIQEQVGKSLTKYIPDVGERTDAVNAIKDYANAVAEDMKKVAEIERTMGSLIVKPKEQGKPTNILEEVVVTPTSGGGAGGGTPLSEEEAKKAVNAKLEAEELRHQNELANLKRAYLADDTMTQKEYAALAEDLELQHLNRQLEIAGLEPDKRAAIEQKILDARIKFEEDCAKETEQQNKEAQEKALTQREKQYQLEVEEATSKHYREMTSEAEFLQQLADMELAYYQDMLANYELTEEQKEQFQQKIRENRLQQEEADYQKRKEQQEKDRALAQKYTDIAKSVASDYGTTIGEMIADGELTMKNFLKETLLMSVDALEKVVEICVVEVMARNLAATAPFSFIGAAKAALQIAAIKAGFAVVKGLIGNFYTGGYTGGGAWDEPKGVVHSNEFVANRFAVANPSVRPVLDLINQAQRNNTISTLSAADISRVLPGANGGQTVVVQNDNPELMRLIAECSQAVGTLHNRLKHPIKAITTVSGRGGIDKATKEFESMNNNVSR